LQKPESQYMTLIGPMRSAIREASGWMLSAMRNHHQDCTDLSRADTCSVSHCRNRLFCQPPWLHGAV